VDQVVGNRVRQHRERLGISKAELAKAAKVSTAVVTKIERSTHSPSLSVLQAISRALNRPLSAFIEDDDLDQQCSYVRASDQRAIRGSGRRRGYSRHLLGHSLENDLIIEPSFVHLEAGAVSPLLSEDQGLELIFMISGSVEYLHANEMYTLGPGDVLLFDTAALHGPKHVVSPPVTYISICISRRL
jgi:transcriptional regulator with XRE-family HTH domain